MTTTSRAVGNNRISMNSPICSSQYLDREVERRREAEMSELIEAMARKYNPSGWRWYDAASDDHPAKPIFREREFAQMRAALAVIRRHYGLT